MTFEKITTVATRVGSEEERRSFNTVCFAFDDIYDFMVLNDFSVAEIGDSKVSLEEIIHIMEILECLSAEKIKFSE